MTAGGVAVAAWLAFGWDWLHGFGLAGENQSRTSYMSIPITAPASPASTPTPSGSPPPSSSPPRSPTSSLWTWRGGDWVRAAAWAALALLLATSWLLPWYLIWLLPLAAISSDRPLQLLTLALTAYQLGARIPL